MLLSDHDPEYQLAALSQALLANNAVLAIYDDYYVGAVPFHLTEQRYAEVYRRLQREARPKWGKLVVISAAQRLAVEGFLTHGQTEPDEDIWAAFVDNGLDLTQHEVHLDATLFGRAYISAWPTVDGSGIRCVPESPYEVIHWRSPDRTQEVALKMWPEEDVWRARVYTANDIFAYVAPRNTSLVEDPLSLNANRTARGERELISPNNMAASAPTWQQDGPAMPNPFAPYLPIVPFVAGSRGDVLGRSDLESALDIIDRIMALQLDLLLVSKIMGFPVRWATGIEVPENDEQKAMVTAVERFLTTDNPDANFGQLPAADLRQINSVISSTVTELAAVTETPSSVLATANLANPVSAEALRAQEIPLVHRVLRHQRAFGPSWVKVARLLALELAGTVEVLWADAEVHSEAALTDALVKQVVSLEVPREAAWEQLPDTTPATVARWRTMRAAQNMEDQLAAALLQPPGAQPPTQTVGSPSPAAAPTPQQQAQEAAPT